MWGLCTRVICFSLFIHASGCAGGDNTAVGNHPTEGPARSIETAEPVVPSGPTIDSRRDWSAEPIPENARFVAVDGNDEGPGTEEQPWRNILPALSRLDAGDTLVIRGGTYTASGSSELCGDGVSPFALIGLHGNETTWTTIMGYPGERPRIHHPEGWQTLYICDSSFVRIRHLEISGDANSGNTSPANGLYVVGSHHVVIQDVWSHDNGGCGICTNNSNHITIEDNRVWGNSHWNPYHSSGISMYLSSNEGGGNDPDGYSNRVTGNLVWNNFEDESLGEGQQWGVTDGNGIIIDRNKESGGYGRTLVTNNVLTDNGGPGIMITEAQAVDVVNNTLFHNVRTQVPTVMNNGEIGCNGGYNVRIEANIVVPRKENPNTFQDFSCRDFLIQGNIWVRTRAPRLGPGNITLKSGSRVLVNPQLNGPEGNWTPIGEASGRGAQ